jgi:hypothetical protein
MGHPRLAAVTSAESLSPILLERLLDLVVATDCCQLVGRRGLWFAVPRLEQAFQAEL